MNQVKNFYKPLVLLKLNYIKFMQQKLSKYFLFKTLKAKIIFIKNFLIETLVVKRIIIKIFLIETKITKSVFDIMIKRSNIKQQEKESLQIYFQLHKDYNYSNLETNGVTERL